MGSSLEGDYAAFQERVKRTIYLDNLSPQANESTLREAFGQYGNVVSIHFIPNYLEPRNVPQCALVEMEESEPAEKIITTLDQYPFMISGMPRPVRARAAEVKMFDDRPREPGREISLVWLNQGDPDFEVAKKLKCLARTHAAETSSLIALQLEKEEKLAKEQAATLRANYKKYEMLDSLKADKAALRVDQHYRGGFNK